MIAVSLDNLLFFLLIAVAALFQLLSKALSKAGKSDSSETSTSPGPKGPQPIRRAPRESDADRIRKFLEALGQPPSSTPPPPVLPRTDIPPRPVGPVQPPPTLVPRPPWELLREERRKRDARRKSPPPEQATHTEEVIPPPVPVPAASAFEVHEGALPLEPQQPPIIKAPVEAYAAAARPSAARTDFKEDIATLLASKSSLREAILLREILGTPRGLQALDSTL
jgi:hypothetical protein